jgi:hypothetical protein
MTRLSNLLHCRKRQCTSAIQRERLLSFHGKMVIRTHPSVTLYVLAFVCNICRRFYDKSSSSYSTGSPVTCLPSILLYRASLFMLAIMNWNGSLTSVEEIIMWREFNNTWEMAILQIRTAFCCILYNITYDLTLILLTWRIWWAPNNASKWQMGFNWVFKGLTTNMKWGTGCV